ncbi:hypothetical protein BKA58DRAFT_435864 [Alternaria rosae]|uniref:uncharacterized protein n=1 Tax=Alternaria rosae TaxID=1187941 RepID=UPI001E8CB355|nr:uncharacterized protein BKA58DRAFT_435864 [Alternaria rosae]KAH6878154.1 hypothetical protein BKA58DRAFT_435864 [Alternaria rosae]
MSRSASRSHATATIAGPRRPPTNTYSAISASENLELWKLKTKWPSKGPRSEALVKRNFRVHVDPKEYKDEKGDYRCVVKLEIMDKDGHEFDASGGLIGPWLVSTSAHNFMNVGGPNCVSRAVSVRAYIGYHLQGSSRGIRVQERFCTMFIVRQEWAKSKFTSSQDDRALVVLQHRFTEVKPALYKAPSLGKSDVLVVGYPSENTQQVYDSCKNCQQAGCMYVVKGEAELKVRKLLQYKLSTMPGNSGGPVFLDEMPRTVIATHTGEASEAGFNCATPVDVNFIEAGKAALKQHHSSPHRYMVMHQQAGTSTWVLFQPETGCSSYDPASRTSGR